MLASGHGRHVRGVHVVDRVCALARIEGSVEELLCCVLRIDLLTLLSQSRRAVHVRRIELHRLINRLLEGEAHALIKRAALVTETVRIRRASKSLLTHAHCRIALTTLHAHLLLRQLGRSKIVTR